MFTGLITNTGTLRSSRRAGRVFVLSIESELSSAVEIGSSVAVDGVCLTVVAVTGNTFEVEATGETLRRTTFDRWRGSRAVNLERPLTPSQPLDGHLVTGHVDGIATLVGKRSDNQGVWLDIRPPAELMRYVASQGSVALDGISLTVSSVASTSFSVSTIPHTLEKTIVGQKRIGDSLNIEVDVLARYVERLMSFRHER
jgi:riboflavin synthase